MGKNFLVILFMTFLLKFDVNNLTWKISARIDVYQGL
jgi:hypothetical protein